MGLANWEIAVYALYLEGGASHPVNTEHVALKCFQLAPDSFSWIRHRDIPDKEVARSALMDARKDKYGALVSGRAGRGRGQPVRTAANRSVDGWQLTQAGVKWIMDNQKVVGTQLADHEPKVHRQALLHKLAKVRNHRLFKDFKDQPEGFVPSIGSLAELLRCSVDADRLVWERRFAALHNEAQLAGQDDLLSFLEICKKFLKTSMETQR